MTKFRGLVCRQRLLKIYPVHLGAASAWVEELIYWQTSHLRIIWFYSGSCGRWCQPTWASDSDSAGLGVLDGCLPQVLSDLDPRKQHLWIWMQEMASLFTDLLVYFLLESPDPPLCSGLCFPLGCWEDHFTSIILALERFSSSKLELASWRWQWYLCLFTSLCWWIHQAFRRVFCILIGQGDCYSILQASLIDFCGMAQKHNSTLFGSFLSQHLSPVPLTSPFHLPGWLKRRFIFFL